MSRDFQPYHKLDETEAENWLEEMRSQISAMKREAQLPSPAPDFVEETKKIAKETLRQSVQDRKKRKWVIRGVEGGAVAAAVVAIVVAVPYWNQMGNTSSSPAENRAGSIEESASAADQGSMSIARVPEQGTAELQTSKAQDQVPEMGIMGGESAQDGRERGGVQTFQAEATLPNEKVLHVAANPPVQVSAVRLERDLGYTLYLPEGFEVRSASKGDELLRTADVSQMESPRMWIQPFQENMEEILRATNQEKADQGYTKVEPVSGTVPPNLTGPYELYKNEQQQMFHVYYHQTHDGRVWRMEVVLTQEKEEWLPYFEAILREIVIAP